MLSTEIIKQIATIRGEFQQLEVAFKTLLQSEDKAKSLMSEMVTLAAKTPFDLKGVANGARQLLAYGFASQDVTNTLTRLGNVAAGLGLPLERLTYLYGTTAVQGRLYARDMLQFTTSGIPMLQEMAKMYGKSTEEINAMVSAGKIGFEDVKKVIENMTNSGGKFHNLMEEQSKTITGQISNLGDAIDVMFNNIGKSQEGVISGAISGTTYLVENYEKVLDVLTVLVATYGAHKATLMLVAATSKGYTIAQLAQYGALLMAEKAQKLLNATMLANPYVLAAVAVVGLATALWVFHDGTSAAEKAQQKLNEATKECDKSIASETAQIDAMFARLKNAKRGTDEYRSAKEAIMSRYGEHLKKLGDEKNALNDVAAAYKLITEEAKKAARARAMDTFTQGAADTFAEKEVDAKDEVRELLKKKYGDKKGSDGISLSETYYWKIKPILEGESEITPEIEKILKDFNKTKNVMVGMAANEAPIYEQVVTNDIKDQINKASKARGIYNKVMSEAQMKFGENPNPDAGVKKDNVFDATGKSISEIEDAISKGQEKLNDFNKAIKENNGLTEDGKTVTSGAVQSQQNYINSLRKTVLERENDLKVIREVEERIDKLQNDQKETVKGSKEYNDLQNRIDSLSRRVKDPKPDKDIEKAQKEYLDAKNKAEEQFTQASISLANEESNARIAGWEREKQNAALSHTEISALNEKIFNERISQIDAEETRKLAAIEAEKTAFIALAKVSKVKLTDGDLKIFDAKKGVVTQSSELDRNKVTNNKTQEEKQQIDEILKEFETYQQKRERIAKEYNDKIAKLDVATQKDAIEEGKRLRDKAIAELDNSMMQSTSLMARLFENMSGKSIAYIRGVADEADALLIALQGDYSAGVGSAFGISEEQFNQLKQSPKELQAIRTEIENTRNTANGAEIGFKKFAQGLKDIGSAIKSGDANKFAEGFGKIQNVAQSATQLLSGLSDAMSNIAELSGSDVFSSIAEGLSNVVTVANEVIGMASAGAAFGPIGAAVGAVIGLVSSITGILAKNKKHREELKKQIAENNMQAYLGEFEVNQLWRQRYEWAQKIGESTLSNIKRQGEELKKQSSANAKEQEELWGKLMGTSFKSGEHFKKTGLFGWGKGKIVEEWTSLAGKSWEEIEKLATQGKLSEEGMKYYEALKKAKEEGFDLADRQEQYLEQLRELTTGSTYDGVVSGIIDGFKAGKRSAADFASTFDDLMQGAVVSALNLLANEKMRKWYEDFAEMGEDGYTDDEIAQAKADYLKYVEQLGEDAKALEQATGVTIGNEEREATKRGIATASQQSVDENNGLLTAIQGHTYSISESVRQIQPDVSQVRSIVGYMAETASRQLQVMYGIETNTRSLVRLERMELDMGAVKVTLNNINEKGIKIRQ